MLHYHSAARMGALVLAIMVRAHGAVWAAPPQETGFRSIFDGQTLKGWDCDPDFWRVEDGVMTGEAKADRQPKQNTFCIWRGGTPGDFELRLSYRLTGGNSGVQYRSVERPDVAKWVLQGYQADIDAQQQYTGQNYEERGRGFLAMRGQFNRIEEGKKYETLGSLGDAELKSVLTDGWNELQIIARGGAITHIINGRVMSHLIDEDTAKRKLSGLVGVQLHVTKDGMKIEVRNIRIREM